MWSISKKKEWIDETFSVISGNAAELHVTIYGFPCRKAKGGNQWRYRYPDFGYDFITELSDRQLSDFAAVTSALTEGKPVRGTVTVNDLPEITVEIQGRPSPHKNEFFSDLPMRLSMPWIRMESNHEENSEQPASPDRR